MILPPQYATLIDAAAIATALDAMNAILARQAALSASLDEAEAAHEASLQTGLADQLASGQTIADSAYATAQSLITMTAAKAETIREAVAAMHDIAAEARANFAAANGLAYLPVLNAAVAAAIAAAQQHDAALAAVAQANQDFRDANEIIRYSTMQGTQLPQGASAHPVPMTAELESKMWGVTQ